MSISKFAPAWAPVSANIIFTNELLPLLEKSTKDGLSDDEARILAKTKREVCVDKPTGERAGLWLKLVLGFKIGNAKFAPQTVSATSIIAFLLNSSYGAYHGATKDFGAPKGRYTDENPTNYAYDTSFIDVGLFAEKAENGLVLAEVKFCPEVKFKKELESLAPADALFYHLCKELTVRTETVGKLNFALDGRVALWTGDIE